MKKGNFVENKSSGGSYKLLLGDCLGILKKLPDNKIDSCVTDPPAGISFMGKSWDNDKGGRDEWIKWMCEVMVEVRRVLKPGGHCFVWALPRTSHWTATALEDAGFEIRDIVTHVFGSGFPKSHNIGKAIDKKLGNEREVVGKKENKINLNSGKPGDKSFYENAWSDKNYIDLDITKGTSDWEGWGTADKPAWEAWILCRKPFDNIEINNIQKIIENICQFLLSVNVAELSLMLNQVEQKEELSSVQWSVEQKFNILESLSEQMVMSLLKKMILLFLNIVKLWNNILGELLQEKNKSIISTESRVIIELKILNSYLLENIPKDIIKAKTLNVGQLLNVKIAERNMNINPVQIEESFVVFSALLNIIKKIVIPGQEQEPETNSEDLIKKFPASEHWILCRKPLSEKTIADNVLKWGTGGINIDKSRIETDDKYNISVNEHKTIYMNSKNNKVQEKRDGSLDGGRFPANFIHDGSYEVMEEFDKAGKSKSGKIGKVKTKEKEGTNWFRGDGGEGERWGFGDEGSAARFFYCSKEGRFPANFIHDGSDEVMEEFDKAGKSKGTERIGNPKGTAWFSGEKGPDRIGHWYGDEGSAARFIYVSKASGKEKNAGLDDMEDKEIYPQNNSIERKEINVNKGYKTKNFHPTVKPIKLMTYLINMITPQNGIVLDPFLGSGSTGVAALKEGYKFIGIEKEAEYMKIAKRRIENV